MDNLLKTYHSVFLIKRNIISVLLLASKDYFNWLSRLANNSLTVFLIIEFVVNFFIWDFLIF